jgi:hypothetical protein
MMSFLDQKGRLGDDMASVQGLEDGDAIWPADNGLAVERERLHLDRGRARNDRRIAGCPIVAAAGKQPNGAALAADCSR